MGDLLKTMRSSQLFSVAGLPGRRDPQARAGGEGRPAAVRGRAARARHLRPDDLRGAATESGDDVPAWFLDTDWNDLSFHVSQAFFPRTSAWDNLKQALKGEFDESVWDHLAGTVSAPFTAGEHRARSRSR